MDVIVKERESRTYGTRRFAQWYNHVGESAQKRLAAEETDDGGTTRTTTPSNT